MNEEQKNAVEIARLDARFEGLTGKVDKILDNHLPHLQAGIDRVADKQDQQGQKIAFWGGGLAVLAILIPVILFILGHYWK